MAPPAIIGLSDGPPRSEPGGNRDADQVVDEGPEQVLANVGHGGF